MLTLVSGDAFSIVDGVSKLCVRIRRNTDMPSSEEVFDKVKETLIDALGLDDDEIKALTGA